MKSQTDYAEEICKISLEKRKLFVSHCKKLEAQKKRRESKKKEQKRDSDDEKKE